MVRADVTTACSNSTDKSTMAPAYIPDAAVWNLVAVTLTRCSAVPTG